MGAPACSEKCGLNARVSGETGSFAITSYEISISLFMQAASENVGLKACDRDKTEFTYGK